MATLSTDSAILATGEEHAGTLVCTAEGLGAYGIEGRCLWCRACVDRVICCCICRIFVKSGIKPRIKSRIRLEGFHSMKTCSDRATCTHSNPFAQNRAALCTLAGLVGRCACLFVNEGYSFYFRISMAIVTKKRQHYADAQGILHTPSTLGALSATITAIAGSASNNGRQAELHEEIL